MEIVIKLGTHSSECVKVCRKCSAPKVGERIYIKKLGSGQKEFMVLITEKSEQLGHYFGDYV